MQSKRKWLPGWQRIELVELCLEQGLTRRQAAAWRRVSVSTVQYWVSALAGRQRERATRRVVGEDRPSTPHHQPACQQTRSMTGSARQRQRTGWGPRLIASELGMAHATVWRCLARRGLSGCRPAEREKVRRFEWPCPGDLLQMDTKRLARFSRPGHRVTGDRDRTAPRNARASAGSSATRSSTITPAWPTPRSTPTRKPHRDRIRRSRPGVLRRPRHHPPAAADRQCLVLRPQPTACASCWPSTRSSTAGSRPDPKRNGKVERYQQTLAREWAYGQRYRNSDARAAALPHWLDALQLHPQPQLDREPATHQAAVRNHRGTTARSRARSPPKRFSTTDGPSTESDRRNDPSRVRRPGTACLGQTLVAGPGRTRYELLDRTKRRSLPQDDSG